jgi:hypothetical protein
MSINDITNAVNRRRAKYAKRERDRDKHGIIDLTSAVPQQQSTEGNKRALRGTVVSSNQNNKPAIFIIQEDKNKGFPYLTKSSSSENEYEKYSKMFDGDADDLLLAQNATIISSTLELTDSSGRNRTIVRRNQ